MQAALFVFSRASLTLSPRAPSLQARWRVDLRRAPYRERSQPLTAAPAREASYATCCASDPVALCGDSGDEVYLQVVKMMFW